MRRSLVGNTRDYASKFNRETWFSDMVDKHRRLLSNSGGDPSLIEILALLPSLRDRLLQNPSEEARALVERFEELYAGDITIAEEQSWDAAMGTAGSPRFVGDETLARANTSWNSSDESSAGDIVPSE